MAAKSASKAPGDKPQQSAPPSASEEFEAAMERLRPLWPLIAPSLVVLTALAVRLYYLSLTRDQPVWWDEAEYLLKAKSWALGTPDSGFFSGRPLGMSLVMAVGYALGMGEYAMRLGIALSGVALVGLVHFIGTRLWSVTAGFVAASLLGLHTTYVFFSTRLMTELPHTALALAATSLLLVDRSWARRLAGPALVCAISTRYTAGMMLAPLGLYVLASEGRSAFSRRDYLVSAALGCLLIVPFLVRDYVSLGHPLASWRASVYLMPPMAAAERIDGVLWYLGNLRTLGRVLLAALAAGVGLALWDLLPRGRLPADVRAARARSVLLFAWCLLPLVYFGGYVRPLLDRYMVLAFVPVFLWIGAAVDRMVAFAYAWQRVAGPLLVVGLLLSETAPLVQRADATVRAKLDSYAALQQAGLWLAANSGKHDVIWSTSLAQFTYYSERENLNVPLTRANFDEQLRSAPPRYIVLSSHEGSPDFIAEAAPVPEQFSRLGSLVLAPYVWRSKAHHSALGIEAVVALPSDNPRAFIYAPVAAGARRP